MSHEDLQDALGEQLSALWDGSLPDTDAEMLRQRIDAEPEVAARWDRLCRTLAALEALPDALPPPPFRGLPAPAPVEAAVGRRAAPRPVAGWVGGLLAAAAVALWLVPRPAPELVLASGTQWVDGEVRLAAGDVLVDVDGEVWVTVEPAAPLPRVGAAEGAMDRRTVMAGLAGAAVTVGVVQGVAVVRGADEAAAVTVSAGETRRIAPAGPAPARAGGTPAAVDRHAEVARLEAELADAKQALAEAEFAGAVTRGQLQALQGTPSAWPADVPAALSPEGFRAGLAEQLAALGDAVEVVSVDCDEFPCLAVIHNTGAAGGDWNDRVRDAVGGWLRGSVPGPLSVSANTSAFSNGDHTEEYVIFGAHTADRESDVGQRTEYRIDAAISELGEQLREE